MKIVINGCFGGFGLSPKGLKMFYELKGIKAYCFKEDYSSGDFSNRKYVPIEGEGNESAGMFFTAFSVPNPNDFDKDELWGKHHLDQKDMKRDDSSLVKIVEDLKGEASGSCASLQVVEVPDGTDWQIEEYDGNEHVAEKHNTWS